MVSIVYMSRRYESDWSLSDHTVSNIVADAAEIC